MYVFTGLYVSIFRCTDKTRANTTPMIRLYS